MAEEAADVKSEVTEADFGDFGDEVEETTTKESSTEETKSEAAAKAEEPAKETATEGEAKETESEEEAEKADESETEEEAKTEETETEQPKKGAEARKAELNDEIRGLVTRRGELRDQVSKLNEEAYQPATVEQLVEGGMDEADAKVAAAEDRTKLAEFNAHVADVNANLNTESLQVMSDFPEFDPDSELFDADLAQLAKDHYSKVAGTKVDKKTGMIYDIAVLPYDTYKTIALIHRQGAKNGQVQGQKSTEKMLQAAETTSSAAPKKAKVDPLLELWSD